MHAFPCKTIKHYKAKVSFEPFIPTPTYKHSLLLPQQTLSTHLFSQFLDPSLTARWAPFCTLIKYFL